MNPYLQVVTRRLTRGWNWGTVLVPVVGTLGAAWLVAPGVEAAWSHPDAAERVGGLFLRVATVVVGWLGLSTYSALIRTDDRFVWGILPIDEARVVGAALVRVGLGRLWLVPAGVAVLGPLALRDGALGWRILAGLGVAWWLGLGAGLATHLLAVRVAESPAFAPLLDLVRGQNPRAQAAFLYAPGVTLAATGAALVSLTEAVVSGAMAATAVGLAVLGLGIALVLPSLARGALGRAQRIVAEIDARDAAGMVADEGRRVPAEFTARWLPARWRAEALLEFRFAWRARRGVVTGAWLVGAGAWASGWTDDPSGPMWAGLVAVLGGLMLGSLAAWSEADEPTFLRRWLPRVARRGARAWVIAVLGWPIVAVPALGVAWRAGGAAGEQVALRAGLGLGLGLVIGASVGAMSQGAVRGYGVLAAGAAVLLSWGWG